MRRAEKGRERKEKKKERKKKGKESRAEERRGERKREKEAKPKDLTTWRPQKRLFVRRNGRGRSAQRKRI